MAKSEERWALLSVTDKSGIEGFAQGLVAAGFRLLSTGGTAKALVRAGLPVVEVAEFSGSPEVFDGRVKTLHPKVHGAILHDRSNPAHVQDAAKLGIGRIDVVAVNLYRFAEAAAQGQSAEEVIEAIDVGGPSMLRGAAKNWQHVFAVVDPSDYPSVLAALQDSPKAQQELRLRLAAKVFATLAHYDGSIARYLDAAATGPKAEPLASPLMPLPLERVMRLRYGENPHQGAGLYRLAGSQSGFANPQILQGKELSYNNILDLDAALALVYDFDQPAVAIIKHTNPCGVASAVDAGSSSVASLFARALATDPKSAFGGIVAFNRAVDAAAAESLVGIFLECVAAPDFTSEAVAILQKKPNLRVLRASAKDYGSRSGALCLRSVQGAVLLQEQDHARTLSSEFKVATKVQPDAPQNRDLEFAMIVAKHVKSNAIVLAKGGATLGIGAGQMSRVDSCRAATEKAREGGQDLHGAVLASDAFFPFRDTVDYAASIGVAAVVQPGGSIRDQESIVAADEHGLAMVMTGRRHFKH